MVSSPSSRHRRRNWRQSNQMLTSVYYNKLTRFHTHTHHTHPAQIHYQKLKTSNKPNIKFETSTFLSPRLQLHGKYFKKYETNFRKKRKGRREGKVSSCLTRKNFVFYPHTHRLLPFFLPLFLIFSVIYIHHTHSFFYLSTTSTTFYEVLKPRYQTPIFFPFFFSKFPPKILLLCHHLLLFWYSSLFYYMCVVPTHRGLSPSSLLKKK